MESAEHPPAHVVELTALIRGPVATVWGAILDPERQGAWLGGFRFEGGWTVGAPLALVGTLNGKPYRESGVLLAFEPERRIRYSHWSKLWRVPESPANRAILTLTLEPHADGTRVLLHHALPDVEAIEPHSRFFWRGGLEQLRRLVKG